ncbi:glutaredoxin family protein [Phormidesmis priestleyi ULC007]|uniref:Glutaredoxin family protein n=1 Tax=Phormidesmis priestleyi ULC007 TaxID=1920490 RepID=A0A2T1D8R4_9CYAN|nr:glutaredoxin family protein [Phormidesmis priestleyi]PSB16843.1 glutaredoxin family protein [Phormidesmis priestleyi ULC007]PZO47758.1 MAG: glutaredoxin family protein [Phormidesmis priestleyi]
MKLVLYSKPGCHLCEGLQEKLAEVRAVTIELEIRDITTRDDWFQAYQYEIPVLYTDSVRLPRPSPRATVQQLESLLQKFESST